MPTWAPVVAQPAVVALPLLLELDEPPLVDPLLLDPLLEVVVPLLLETIVPLLELVVLLEVLPEEAPPVLVPDDDDAPALVDVALPPEVVVPPVDPDEVPPQSHAP